MADIASKGIWPLIVTVLNSLQHGRLPPTSLIKVLISRVLGLGIVAGSTMVKLPQVAAIVRAGSAQGLSPLSFELETFGLAIVATYGLLNNLAFSAYGESVAMLAQNVLLLLLIYRYQKRSFARTCLLFMSLSMWGAALSSSSIAPSQVAALYDLTNVIQLASRVPQIMQNYKSKSTGQLSLVTYGLNVAGASARIFTTLNEKNAGSAMLRGAMLGTVLNGIMVAQIVGYSKKKAAKKKRV